MVRGKDKQQRHRRRKSAYERRRRAGNTAITNFLLRGRASKKGGSVANAGVRASATSAPREEPGVHLTADRRAAASETSTPLSSVDSDDGCGVEGSSGGNDEDAAAVDSNQSSGVSGVSGVVNGGGESDNPFGRTADDDAELRAASVMHVYIGAIVKQLKRETLQNTPPGWLLRMLMEDCPYASAWRLWSFRAKTVCEKLKVKFEHPAYYRDVIVWFPHKQFGADGIPRCKHCQSNADVKVLQIRSDHLARRIYTMQGDNYFAVTPRFICRSCQRAKRPNHSFMGWDTESLVLMPHGYGDLFPAFLTPRAGVDKTVLDWMRPTFMKGCRPTSFSDSMLEVAAKKHMQLQIFSEFQYGKLLGQHGLGTEPHHTEILSPFSDPLRYDVKCPSGKYLTSVLQLHNKQIRAHFDREVKKRSIDTLAVDASYKTSKRMYKVAGLPMFGTLVTWTNHFGEVRQQYNAVTDAHDQHRAPIMAMMETAQAHGHTPPVVVFTDNPLKDKRALMSAIPSLRTHQDDINATLPLDARPLPLYTTDDENIDICDGGTTRTHNALLDLMKREVLDGDYPFDRVLSLDTEWRVLNGRRQRIALVQIGYKHPNGAFRAVLVRINGKKTLPAALVALLGNQKLLFAGKRIEQDLQFIHQDFNCPQAGQTQYVDLAHMAHDRGMARSRRVSLDKIVQLVLHKRLNKDPSIRVSNWESSLSAEQKQYAACDVTAALEAYFKMSEVPNMRTTLRPDEAVPGTAVHILPKGGSSGLAGCIATGRIVAAAEWKCPLQNSKPAILKPTLRRRLVEIVDVHAPGHVIPWMRVDGAPISFGQLQQNSPTATFTVMLPLTMISAFIDARPTATTPPPQLAASPSEKRDEGAPVDAPTSHRVMSESDWEVAEAAALTESREVNAVQAAAAAARPDAEYIDCPQLGDPPEVIHNTHSVVKGDPFHYMRRPNVPTSHDYKKSFFVALRRAWFVFDEDRLQLVKAVLRRDDQLTDSQIDAKMYYDFAFFRDRVPRRVPPPAEHYRRVRAVFALFGPLLDSTTCRPLFNQEAWNKARNVLEEIIAGHCADPPDFAMYMPRVDDDGNPVKDFRGLHLYDSMRGTNLTECAHKQMLAAIGAWPCGVETGDCLLSEWRHRYNHRIAERRRPGFPRVGHVDTWLVDTLQHLIQQNRQIDLFPGWVPASDFVDTPEQFGTVPLHSAALGDAIRAIRLKESVKLEGDHAYIAKCMKLPLPLLPVYTTKAKALFRKIVRPYIESMDFDKMAIEWCQHVDGQDIMPVLPAHLRSHFALWQRSERVQDAMDKAESGVAALAKLNHQTAAIVRGRSNQPTVQDALPLTPSPVVATDRRVVGWHTVKGAPSLTTAEKRRRGQRGKDLAPRKQRHCVTCSSASCPGRRRKADCWTQLALQRGSKPFMAQLRRASLRSAGRQRATPTPGAPAKRGRLCPTKRQKNAKVAETPIVPVYRLSNRHLQMLANTGCPWGRNFDQPAFVGACGLTLRARIVNFWSGTDVHCRLDKWMKQIGFCTKLDTNASQIGSSCGIVAAVAVNSMRCAAGDWFDVPALQIAESASQQTLARVAHMAPDWATSKSYPVNGSQFIKGNELTRLWSVLTRTAKRTRASTEARTRMGGIRIQPLDLFLLSVARDVLAGAPVVRMCIVNNSMCDEIGLHWMAVVYSVQAQSRPAETFVLKEMEVAPGVHRSWFEFMS